VRVSSGSAPAWAIAEPGTRARRARQRPTSRRRHFKNEGWGRRTGSPHVYIHMLYAPFCVHEHLSTGVFFNPWRPRAIATARPHALAVTSRTARSFPLPGLCRPAFGQLIMLCPLEAEGRRGISQQHRTLVGGAHAWPATELKRMTTTIVGLIKDVITEELGIRSSNCRFSRER